MALHIILLGLPGSGKGTQAERLAAEFDLVHLSTGNEFRAIKKEDSDFARRVAMIMDSVMDAGLLVDDETTFEVAERRMIEEKAKQNGLILDGFPRNVYQADKLKDWLASRDRRINLAVLLEVPKEVTLHRIEERARREKRADDARQIAEKRYAEYLEQTAPLIPYYEEHNLLQKVDGNRPIEAVTAELVRMINATLRA